MDEEEMKRWDAVFEARQRERCGGKRTGSFLKERTGSFLNEEQEAFSEREGKQ